MAEDAFEGIRLVVMQDILPVGMALIKRAKSKGPNGLIEVLTELKDPLKDLRSEGESSAKEIRDQLDDLSPGLGNPVMKVKIAVDEINLSTEKTKENNSLILHLNSIEERLQILSKYLDEGKVPGIKM